MGLDKCWQPTPLLLPKESPEEPDGLLFMGWHRVGHNLAAAAASHTEYLPSPKKSFMLPLIISPCPDQFLATTDLFTVCNSFAFPKRLNSWNHIVCNPFKLVSHTL